MLKEHYKNEMALSKREELIKNYRAMEPILNNMLMCNSFDAFHSTIVNIYVYNDILNRTIEWADGQHTLVQHDEFERVEGTEKTTLFIIGFDEQIMGKFDCNEANPILEVKQIISNYQIEDVKYIITLAIVDWYSQPQGGSAVFYMDYYMGQETTINIFLPINEKFVFSS